MNDQRLGIRATRVYVILLVISLIVMTFYSSLTVYTRFITVPTPSRVTFEQLQSLNQLTLTCRCTQVVMPHERIMDISYPQYHQVRKRLSTAFIVRMHIDDRYFLLADMLQYVCAACLA